MNIRGLSIVLLCLALLILSALWIAPPLNASDRIHIRIPRDLASLRALYSVVARLQSTHFVSVMWCYLVLYVVLQTCSIPGSIFLSFLGGALFGVPLGVLLVALAAACGATGSYLISSFALRSLVERLAPTRLARFRALVNERRRSDLFWIMIGLRITPLLPNWFINAASPVVGMPIVPFFVGTFLGVMPPSVFHVRAGVTLDQLVNASDALDWSAVLSLCGLGLVAVLPTLPGVSEFFFGKPAAEARLSRKLVQFLSFFIIIPTLCTD
jgi:uncharacterized membrane protein YdjX (TVP38/TMEM64 family)